MKIALICGSPRGQKSVSSGLLADLGLYLKDRAEVLPVALNGTEVSEETLQLLAGADVWVVAAPLYFDALPGHLLYCLQQLEPLKKPERRVYGIMNCGFYEGIQTAPALKILENFCRKADFHWCGGLGVGAGGSLKSLPDKNPEKGPKAPINKQLRQLADAVLAGETFPNTYVSPAIPRRLYQAAAEFLWRRGIRKNGGRARDLGKRP